MGKYTPGKPTRQKSLSDALLEAEEDHLLDCPNADFTLRAAALLLDVILFSLANSGIQHFFDTLESYALHLAQAAPGEGAGRSIALVSMYLALVAKIGAGYLFFVWSVSRFRGSPGKQLLGLRVVASDTGAPLRPFIALVRETFGKALSVVSLVGMALPLWRPDQRALHDLVAGSVVKRLHGGPPP